MTPDMQSTEENVRCLNGSTILWCWAQNTVLRNKNFYEEMGLYLSPNIAPLSTEGIAVATSLIISNKSDAQRIAIIDEATFNLIF